MMILKICITVVLSVVAIDVNASKPIRVHDSEEMLNLLRADETAGEPFEWLMTEVPCYYCVDRNKYDFVLDNFEYRVIGNDSLTIRFSGMDNANNIECNGYVHIPKMDIPAHISFQGKKYKVAAISPMACTMYIANIGNSKTAHYKSADVDTVVIPVTVKEIGQRAFCGCGIEKLYLNEGLKTIGHRAFAGNYIDNIQIPSTVMEIGQKAFAANPKLDNVIWPAHIDTIPEYCFYRCINLRNFNMDDVACLKEGALAYTAIPSIKVPEGMIEIPFQCFKGCVRLRHIDFPSGLRKINEEALMFVPLETDRIPDGVEYLGSFSCAETDTLYIPASVKYIAPDALHTCKVRYFYVDPENTNYISIDGVVYNREMDLILAYPSLRKESTFVIPAGVKWLQDRLFFYCASLRSLTIPASVTNISNLAFNISTIKEVHVEWTETNDVSWCGRELCKPSPYISNMWYFYRNIFMYNIVDTYTVHCNTKEISDKVDQYYMDNTHRQLGPFDPEIQPIVDRLYKIYFHGEEVSI